MVLRVNYFPWREFYMNIFPSSDRANGIFFPYTEKKIRLKELEIRAEAVKQILCRYEKLVKTTFFLNKFMNFLWIFMNGVLIKNFTF